MIERTSTEQHEVMALSECLIRLGIYDTAFDNDDTLVNTRKVFRRGMHASISSIASKSNPNLLTTEETLRYMKEVISAIRPEFHTHSSIMRFALHNTARRVGIEVPDESEGYQEAVKSIMDIYYGECPRAFPGAHHTVDTFNQTHVTSYLATHSPLDITLRKVKQEEFDGKFAKYWCFDVCRSKAEQWPEVLTENGVNPPNLLVIGNNPKEDIEPTLKLNIPLAIWINQSNSPIPNYLEGYVDKDQLIVVNDISEVIPAIINHE